MRIKAFIFLSVLLLAYLFSACGSKQDCEIDHTGVIEAVNQSQENVDVYVDGTNTFELGPGDIGNVKIASGTHFVRALGNPPNEISDSLDVIDCETAVFEVDFP